MGECVGAKILLNCCACNIVIKINSEQPTKYKIIFLLLHVSTSVLMRTKSRKCQTHDKEAVNIFGLCVSLEWE